MYAITVTVQRTTADGWESARALPLFYLDSRTQGIVSTEHAERIARRMLTDVNPDATFHVYAFQLEEDPA
jgi:hypothetical protein